MPKITQLGSKVAELRFEPGPFGWFYIHAFELVAGGGADNLPLAWSPQEGVTLTLTLSGGSPWKVSFLGEQDGGEAVSGGLQGTDEESAVAGVTGECAGPARGRFGEPVPPPLPVTSSSSLPTIPAWPLPISLALRLHGVRVKEASGSTAGVPPLEDGRPRGPGAADPSRDLPGGGRHC